MILVYDCLLTYLLEKVTYGYWCGEEERGGKELLFTLYVKDFERIYLLTICKTINSSLCFLSKI